MLPRAARLNRSTDFRRVTRSGVRAGRPTLVVHAAAGAEPGVRVGLVVSKAVGNAVTRNRVKRRLRHLAADRLPGTPAGTDLVVRALAPAGTACERLTTDLASAWSQVLGRLERRAPAGAAAGARP